MIKAYRNKRNAQEYYRAEQVTCFATQTTNCTFCPHITREHVYNTLEKRNLESWNQALKSLFTEGKTFTHFHSTENSVLRKKAQFLFKKNRHLVDNIKLTTQKNAIMLWKSEANETFGSPRYAD